MEPTFSLAFTPVQWAVLCATLIPVLWVLTVYRNVIRRVSRSAAGQSATMAGLVADGFGKVEFPPVSVIVYAAGTSERLERLLPELFAQDYPAAMEVIVVSDGQNEDLHDAVSRYRAANRGCDLYFTFAPDRARNLSRKKLAVTLGVKAAKYPVVVNVCDTSEIGSRHWLAAMVRKFRRKDVALVIGCAVPVGDGARGHRFRTFSAAADAVTYLSAGLAGKAYRGDGHNLAYRRETFFANSGFGHSLNLHDGDDDLFVGEISGNGKTLVELSSDSLVGIVASGSPRAAWRREKRARAFTAGMSRKGTRLLFGSGAFMLWIWIVPAAAAIVMTWCNLSVLSVVIAEFLGMWLPLSLSWRKSLRSVGVTDVALIRIPGMLMRRPWSNLRFKISARRHRSDHYTWVS